MKRLWQRFVGTLPLIVCVCLIAAVIAAVTPSQWKTLGDGAAVLAVGLQAPRESAIYLEEERRSRDVKVSANAPSLPAVFTGELYEAAASVIPPKGEGGGAVSEEQLGGGVSVCQNVTVKNGSGVNVDFSALFEAGTAFAQASDGPQVLIVHTHATESYMSYYAGYYNDTDSTRTTDNAENVTAVGEAIARELRAVGIGVIHDTTHHDHPAYTGAYSRSEQTIKCYLEKYPSIRVVLDIHRDAVVREDLTKVKPTVNADGQKAAQMMLVVGTASDNAYLEQNLRLALQLHNALENRCEGIMRPMYLVDARYNQGLCANSLLVEVGTDANTLSEAIVSGRLLAKELGVLLTR